MVAMQEVWCLPFELQLQIIDLLSIEEKMTCMLVCKSWYARMLDPALWSSYHSIYEKKVQARRRKPKTNYTKALDYSQGKLIQLYSRLPRGVCQRLVQHLVTSTVGRTLRRLALDNLGRCHTGNCRALEQPWLDFCAGTLESLRLRSWCKVYLPDELAALRSLELRRCQMNNGHGSYLPLLTSFKTDAWSCESCTDKTSSSLSFPRAAALHLEFTPRSWAGWDPGSDWSGPNGEQGSYSSDQVYTIECSASGILTLRIDYPQSDGFRDRLNAEKERLGQCITVERFLGIYRSRLKSLKVQRVGCDVENVLKTGSIADVLPKWAIDIKASAPPGDWKTYHVFATAH